MSSEQWDKQFIDAHVHLCAGRMIANWDYPPVHIKKDMSLTGEEIIPSSAGISRL